MLSTTGFKRKCSNASVVSEKVIQDAAAALEFKSPSVPLLAKGEVSKMGSREKRFSSRHAKNFDFLLPSLKKRG